MSAASPFRRRIALLLVLSTMLPLAGCSSMGTLRAFLGGTVVVTDAELQQRFDRRFPRDFELGGGIATLTLEQPQSRLQDDQLWLAFDVQATVAGLRVGPRGHFALVSGLRFDPDSQALYLHEPRLTRLDLPRMPGLPAGEELLALGDALLAEYARNEPVYVLSERRQSQVPLGRSVYRVDIENGRIVIGVTR
ncbi:DUF1439 domain-containing protein [Pseudoxanthomonas suwonensis]|uniref:DUF1439 domain-containing protein n=1 Tax=Pseudoxanthomonas suwonensis TaxID=314722 RepID=A0A0E3Z0T8_9GAMM|nr:DUF1439 domain-containing protein [Pseudoxanthomonas suwonensis]AKC86202.1 hypothetical protein WQ53_04850 [Pseudoxanthomonas suwonensis]